jgi:hypothetical protein
VCDYIYIFYYYYYYYYFLQGYKGSFICLMSESTINPKIEMSLIGAKTWDTDIRNF